MDERILENTLMDTDGKTSDSSDSDSSSDSSDSDNDKKKKKKKKDKKKEKERKKDEKEVIAAIAVETDTRLEEAVKPLLDKIGKLDEYVEQNSYLANAWQEGQEFEQQYEVTLPDGSTAALHDSEEYDAYYIHDAAGNAYAVGVDEDGSVFFAGGGEENEDSESGDNGSSDNQAYGAFSKDKGKGRYGKGAKDKGKGWPAGKITGFGGSWKGSYPSFNPKGKGKFSKSYSSKDAWPFSKGAFPQAPSTAFGADKGFWPKGKGKSKSWNDGWSYRPPAYTQFAQPRFQQPAFAQPQWPQPLRFTPFSKKGSKDKEGKNKGINKDSDRKGGSKNANAATEEDNKNNNINNTNQTKA